jgi:leucyl aminopeptidase
MLMAGSAPVRLRVLIAAVENNIAGNAFRPGDVLTARNGRSTVKYFIALYSR